jgi:DNA-directed RNA polymerase subunit M/transcription elongation factor TFIIS
MNTLQLSQKFIAIEREISEIKAALIEANIMKAPAPAAKKAELPLVEAKVTARFRASVSHPFSVVANFECPACGKSHDQVEFRIGDNGGTTITSCECGQNIRVKLAWDANLK